MTPLLADTGRIWLAVAFAVFAIVVIAIPQRRTLLTYAMFAVSTAASAVTLFHSVFIRLPGWPATLSALYVTLVTLHTLRHSLQHKDDHVG